MNLEKAQAAAKAAIEKFHYNDICTVSEYKDITDTTTKITKKEEVIVSKNIPCKLSFETIKNAEQTETATAISQVIKLFLSPDITINPGSKITVTNDGRTVEYKQSGEAAVYPSHQEIMLILFEGWA